MRKRFQLIHLFCFIIFPSMLLHSQEARKSTDPRLGLVLSGGGAKGFAHIGAIRVFKEAGLQFDYISGTSMGSIFGSLYALGYHPDSMEKIVREQNWDFLMNDMIDRKYVPIEEKQNSDRFLMTFPIVEKKVKIKTGLHNGQMIDLLFAKYLSPAYKTQDFSKLSVPFLCIGTNLEDGSNVILDKGVLHKAVRASMSIPSYFTPVVIDGITLVDGGVINNFPVEEVKKRGADIIVGVDVQSGLMKINEINSAIKVLDQVTSFYRISSNERAMNLTDFYIKPDLEGYDMMSFSDYDTLIKRGEDAARAQLPALKRLADSLNKIYPRQPRELNAKPLDSLFVTQLRYEGLKMVSKEFLDGALDIKPMSWVKLPDVDEAMKRAYGSGFFESINYYFLPNELGVGLVFEITEASSGLFGVGIHYDSDYKVGLLLNATFKNVGIKGSKIFTDLNLGENPRFQALYLVDRGTRIGFGVKLTALNLDFNVYLKDDITDVFRFNLYNLSAFGQWTFRNTMRLRAGVAYETSSLNSGFNNPFLDKGFNGLLIPRIDWAIDSYDKNYFSTRGHKLNVGIKYLFPVSPDANNLFDGRALIASFMYNKNFPMGKKNVLKAGASAGLTLKDSESPPLSHWFYLGGQASSNYLDGFVPFTGLKFVEQAGLYGFSLQMAWQYNIFSKFYIIPKADVGVLSVSWEDFTEKPDFLVGYGVTLSYESFVGPVELTLMGGNRSGKLGTFINIGYWF